MDRSEAAGRLAEARVGRLATVTADGRAHLVPCCFAVVDEVVYSAVDGKPKTTLALRRLDNVRASRTASLLVDHYEEDWERLWWVRVDGPARVIETNSSDEWAAALDVLGAKYPQYRRARPKGPVVSVPIRHWAWWAATG
jgi:PPOX class probable F420-dependent enzyme